MPMDSGIAAPFPPEARGTPLRREVWAWSALAIASLGVSGVFALLLAVSRIPGVESVFPWPLGFFHKGLVIHVVFSFVVWFLAAFGAMLTLATGAVSGGVSRLNGLGSIATGAVALSGPMLFIPALLDRGEATLNNYVPVIIDPLYYAGLIVLGVGLAAASLRFLLSLRGSRGPHAPEIAAMACAAIIYLVSLVCFGLAALLLWGQVPSHAFNEELFWGGGHVLQILNTLLLVIAWIVLARIAAPSDARSRTLLLVSSAVLVATALIGPWFYAIYPPFSADQTEMFSDLQYALGPPTVLVALALLFNPGLRGAWSTPPMRCIAVSILVFAVGGVFGLFVDGADTRTPAHYHGVIAGVTLAFMGLFLDILLPVLDRPVAAGKLRAAAVYCFGFGQLVACVGLFVAGGYGAPRKTAGSDQGLEDWGAIVGMGMNGAGGLVAVVGGVLFIWIVAAALIGNPTRERDPVAGASRPL